MKTTWSKRAAIERLLGARSSTSAPARACCRGGWGRRSRRSTRDTGAYATRNAALQLEKARPILRSAYSIAASDAGRLGDGLPVVGDDRTPGMPRTQEDLKSETACAGALLVRDTAAGTSESSLATQTTGGCDRRGHRAQGQLTTFEGRGPGEPRNCPGCVHGVAKPTQRNLPKSPAVISRRRRHCDAM